MITQSDLHRAKILVVDDDALIIQVLTCLLHNAGYTDVSSTTDPCAVCTLHRVNHYALIVLDLHMPRMDGFAVLESLKQIYPDEYLPVLVVSAESEHKLRALDLGAKDFISKPFDPAEVLSRIRNMLEVRLHYTTMRDDSLRLAHYDTLTGLPNRAMFLHSLDRVLKEHKALTSVVLSIDLDGFRHINETLGHRMADDVLRQFSQRLIRCMPPCSRIGRVGNDEFALVVIGNHQPAHAMAVADQIRQALQAPFLVQTGSLGLTVSIGMAIYPLDASDAATLLKYADMALNQAKQHGHNSCQFFTAALFVQTQRRFDVEQALRMACENGEFELYYQPKLQISTGRMIGAEALLRWNRPGVGRVSPVDFITILEATGMIVPVGEWVIREACRQIALWASSGAGWVHVAVNVASRQFAESDLESVVSRALVEFGISAHWLGVEVTESAMMQDSDRTMATLTALRAMGVQISIDDFGTGYSSLAYLKRFPVDVLKIDIAFIREVTHNPDDAALVDAILAIGHSLDLDVIAEGVETAAQLAYLGSHRCDQIQGYYFSQPLPSAQFEQLLRANTGLVLPTGTTTIPTRTLLIIDDEPHVLTSLSRLLRQDGYHILTASGASDAFNLLAQNRVHVILCDQRMEEMSGTDLLDRVKDMYPDTFRIILSGYTDLASILEAVNRGSLYRFYTKPWDNATLRENLRAAFRHYWQLHGWQLQAWPQREKAGDKVALGLA